MTRINCIDVTLLTDQHLFTEYREITRVSNLARPLSNYGNYTLGEGHVKFFYNKGLYLAKRMKELKSELYKRGYNITDRDYKPHPDNLNNDWLPSKLDQITNLIRLNSKEIEQPDFYTFNKQKCGSNHYHSILAKLI